MLPCNRNYPYEESPFNLKKNLNLMSVQYFLHLNSFKKPHRSIWTTNLTELMLYFLK